ncbi:MAG: ASKHA domain-containing protein [Saccharofermentanales bacterium]
MDLKIRIIDKDQEKETESLVADGELLLSVLQDENSSIHAPCGGRGTCKKCKVEIEGVGEVLSCQTRLDQSLFNKNNEIVVILPRQGKAKIQSGGIMPEFVLEPLLQLKTQIFTHPGITDQLPDDQRISDEAKCSIPFHLLHSIPAALRMNDFTLQYIIRKDKNEMTAIPAHKTPAILHGVAVDIGTTTLAAYLYDLSTGDLIKTLTSLNPQRGFGADVISRIDYASQSRENLDQLQRSIGEKIIDLLFDLSDSIKDIQLLSIAGNTTMMHLLCGINPFAIATAPFIPTTISHKILYAKEIFPFLPDDLDYNPLCILLPSISGYVGADITAGILTCKMDLDTKANVLIDIGTNGEIALSKDGQIVTCSTAAGPAFEGANIICGIGGIAGAIDKVFINNDDIGFTTISGEPSVGICGSGIIAAVATLLRTHIIDETGRFEDDMDLIHKSLHERIVRYNNEKVFVFTTNEENIPQVYLSQKDIREIQNAKAAVCAGILLLMEQQQVDADEIENVYIAGGFGNFLNVEDAFTIGLLPSKLYGKAKMVGNTSGLGASLCLLDTKMLDRCDSIQKKTKYYELSSDKRFTDLYIDAMLFE